MRRRPDAVQRHLGCSRDIHGGRRLRVRFPHSSGSTEALLQASRGLRSLRMQPLCACLCSKSAAVWLTAGQELSRRISSALRAVVVCAGGRCRGVWQSTSCGWPKTGAWLCPTWHGCTPCPGGCTQLLRRCSPAYLPESALETSGARMLVLVCVACSNCCSVSHGLPCHERLVQLTCTDLLPTLFNAAQAWGAHTSCKLLDRAPPRHTAASGKFP